MKLNLMDYWKLICGFGLFTGYIIFRIKYPTIEMPYILVGAIGGGGMALILEVIQKFTKSQNHKKAKRRRRNVKYEIINK